MKKLIFLFFVLLQVAVLAQSGKINLQELDLYAQKVMKDFDVPGMTIGIVRNDSIIFR